MESIGGVRQRAAGFVLLGLLIVVIVLLVVGYGTAVGVGALAGFFTALVVGTVGVLWLGRGPGRSINIGGMEWSSERAGSDPHWVGEIQEVSELSSVDIGRAYLVLPVLTTAEANGVSVQLIIVEVHEAGLAMVVEARHDLGTSAPASMARISVGDEVGTKYTAAAQSDGGSIAASRYTITAIPKPPVGANQLKITIERFFDPFPMGREEARGPWTFSVALGTARS